MAIFSGLRQQYETDHTIQKVKQYIQLARRDFTSVAPRWILAKIPVVSWLPKYRPRWIFNDVFAGLTLGIILISQSIAHSKIAGIPVQYGLISNCFPQLIYSILGTSKDMSVGTISILALLTHEIIKDLRDLNLRPEIIAAAVSVQVGIYYWLMGLLQLGWLLDFISLPVLSGFVSAAALVTISTQVPPMFGLTAGEGEIPLWRDFFKRLPNSDIASFGIGIAGIVMLTLLQQAGKYWGRKYRAIWIISILRNPLVLVIFTVMSYLLNRNRAVPLFPLSHHIKSGLVQPRIPNVHVISRIMTKSLTVFVAASLEYVAIGKAFGRRNGYTTDPAQEMIALGTMNFAGGLLGGMPVTGGLGRSSVNSESRVKSPLGGVATSSIVLLAIYKLTGVLQWVPNAIINAIIIAAVWQIIVPPSVFYKYWRTSLIDFIGSQLAFWITFFRTAEEGISTALLFSVIYLLFRIAFARTILITNENRFDHYPRPSDARVPAHLPEDVKIFIIEQFVIFPNAERISDTLLKLVQTYSEGSFDLDQERVWNESTERNIALQRRKAGIEHLNLPRTQVVILDMSHVVYVDTTGLQALADLKRELIRYCGPALQLRFVGMSFSLRQSFERIGWRLVDEWGDRSNSEDVVYGGIGSAVRDEKRYGDAVSVEMNDVSVDDRKTMYSETKSQTTMSWAQMA